jgi:glycosyltransferase involved in cell wall biosynthesis
MRVLVAHNAYRSSAPSGENAAVLRDVALLRDAGHDVRELARSSDDTSARELAGAGMGVRAPGPAAEFQSLLAEGWRPDVLHVHNVFPLLTTSPMRAARAHGVPVVTTLHNYRRTCAAGTHFRDGGICEDCTGHRVAWPALVHGCYRESRLQTVPVVLNQRLDRAIWADVDAVVALTPYMAARVREDAGNDCVVVRPTSVADPGEPSAPGEGAVFVGRLSVEKGADLLVRAWQAAGPPRTTLTVVGDGPDRDRVAALAAGTPGIRFLGRLDAARVAAEIRRAAVVVVPSLWYEGFPTVVAEALSHGRPVIACDNANMRTVVGDSGWLAPPTPDGIAGILRDVLADRLELARVAARARRRYLREMTPTAGYELLMSAYRIAVERRGGLLLPGGPA